MGQIAVKDRRLCSSPYPLPSLILPPPLKQDLKPKVQSSFKCLHQSTCKRKNRRQFLFPFFFHLVFFPPLFCAVFPSLSPSSFSLYPCAVLSVHPSFTLQVIALCLAMLVIIAWERLPVFVNTPTETPVPAFGWTTLQRNKQNNTNQKCYCAFCCDGLGACPECTPTLTW